MTAMAGPMAAAMAANIEYNLDWACEFDELWSFLRTLADERGILLDLDNPSEDGELQLQELHDELASDVCMLLREHFACVDAVARELVAHRDAKRPGDPERGAVEQSAPVGRTLATVDGRTAARVMIPAR